MVSLVLLHIHFRLLAVIFIRAIDNDNVSILRESILKVLFRKSGRQNYIYVCVDENSLFFFIHWVYSVCLSQVVELSLRLFLWKYGYLPCEFWGVEEFWTTSCHDLRAFLESDMK
jgi:hypothetical protein